MEVSLRDGDKASQASFGREQVVEPDVEPAVGDVVPNAQKMPVLVVEKCIVDVGQLAATNGQLPQFRDPLGGEFRAGDDGGDSFASPPFAPATPIAASIAGSKVNSIRATAVIVCASSSCRITPRSSPISSGRRFRATPTHGAS